MDELKLSLSVAAPSTSAIIPPSEVVHQQPQERQQPLRWHQSYSQSQSEAELHQAHSQQLELTATSAVISTDSTADSASTAASAPAGAAHANADAHAANESVAVSHGEHAAGRWPGVIALDIVKPVVVHESNVRNDNGQDNDRELPAQPPQLQNQSQSLPAPQLHSHDHDHSHAVTQAYTHADPQLTARVGASRPRTLSVPGTEDDEFLRSMSQMHRYSISVSTGAVSDRATPSPSHSHSTSPSVPPSFSAVPALLRQKSLQDLLPAFLLGADFTALKSSVNEKGQVDWNLQTQRLSPFVGQYKYSELWSYWISLTWKDLQKKYLSFLFRHMMLLAVSIIIFLVIIPDITEDITPRNEFFSVLDVNLACVGHEPELSPNAVTRVVINISPGFLFLVEALFLHTDKEPIMHRMWRLYTWIIILYLASATMSTVVNFSWIMTPTLNPYFLHDCFLPYYQNGTLPTIPQEFLVPPYLANFSNCEKDLVWSDMIMGAISGHAASSVVSMYVFFMYLHHHPSHVARSYRFFLVVGALFYSFVLTYARVYDCDDYAFNVSISYLVAVFTCYAVKFVVQHSLLIHVDPDGNWVYPGYCQCLRDEETVRRRLRQIMHRQKRKEKEKGKRKGNERTSLPYDHQHQYQLHKRREEAVHDALATDNTGLHGNTDVTSHSSSASDAQSSNLSNLTGARHRLYRSTKKDDAQQTAPQTQAMSADDEHATGTMRMSARSHDHDTYNDSLLNRSNDGAYRTALNVQQQHSSMIGNYPVNASKDNNVADGNPNAAGNRDADKKEKDLRTSREVVVEIADSRVQHATENEQKSSSPPPSSSGNCCEQVYRTFRGLLLLHRENTFSFAYVTIALAVTYALIKVLVVPDIPLRPFRFSVLDPLLLVTRYNGTPVSPVALDFIHYVFPWFLCYAIVSANDRQHPFFHFTRQRFNFMFRWISILVRLYFGLDLLTAFANRLVAMGKPDFINQCFPLGVPEDLLVPPYWYDSDAQCPNVDVHSGFMEVTIVNAFATYNTVLWALYYNDGGHPLLSMLLYPFCILYPVCLLIKFSYDHTNFLSILFWSAAVGIFFSGILVYENTHQAKEFLIFTEESIEKHKHEKRKQKPETQ